MKTLLSESWIKNGITAPREIVAFEAVLTRYSAYPLIIFSWNPLPHAIYIKTWTLEANSGTQGILQLHFQYKKVSGNDSNSIERITDLSYRFTIGSDRWSLEISFPGGFGNFRMGLKVIIRAKITMQLLTQDLSQIRVQCIVQREYPCIMLFNCGRESRQWISVSNYIGEPKTTT